MLSKRTHFKCSKCDSDVLHERNVMTNHLLKCHGVSPQEYHRTNVIAAAAAPAGEPSQASAAPLATANNRWVVLYT